MTLKTPRKEGENVFSMCEEGGLFLLADQLHGACRPTASMVTLHRLTVFCEQDKDTSLGEDICVPSLLLSHGALTVRPEQLFCGDLVTG